MKNTFADKNIIVTGGTGSVGREIVKALLPYKPKVVRIFDSSEGALFALQQELGEHEEVRYFLGTFETRDASSVRCRRLTLSFTQPH